MLLVLADHWSKTDPKPCPGFLIFDAAVWDLIRQIDAIYIHIYIYIYIYIYTEGTP